MSDPTNTKGVRAALDVVSYYDILAIPRDASDADIRLAFKRFAGEYHPDRYVRESRQDAALAAEIFKRGTEAFAILTNPVIRPLYDEGLSRGHHRFIEGEAAAAAEAAKPRVKTLEDLATTPKAKELARKADRLLVADRIEEARVLLTDAVQAEFENVELQARLYAMYTAQGLETFMEVKAAGSADGARVILTDAVQDDFENSELKARLYALYTADGFETL
jgi:curved DNA-binding protein CbpA